MTRNCRRGAGEGSFSVRSQSSEEIDAIVGEINVHVFVCICRPSLKICHCSRRSIHTIGVGNRTRLQGWRQTFHRNDGSTLSVYGNFSVPVTPRLNIYTMTMQLGMNLPLEST